jgi:hypothetical protein
MICPNLTIGSFNSIGTTATLWPLGTRWSAAKPSAMAAPLSIVSIATTTLSRALRRSVRGSLGTMVIGGGFPGSSAGQRRWHG